MTLMAADTRDAAEAAQSRAARPSLRVAYLTNQYPAVSHTFIRREILELERRGHSVLRLAIRPGADGFVDPLDRDENERTVHCLAMGAPKLALSLVSEWLRQPVRMAKSLLKAVSMGWRSNRGLSRHLAYYVEAACLRGVLRRERIQHLHIHFGTNAAIVGRLIRHMGGPLISMTVHGPIEFDSPEAWSLPKTAADCEFIAAISNYCSAQIRRWIPEDQWDKVHVIGCTVGEEFLRPPTPIDPASKTILCIGRMVQDKGHLVLLQALARAAKRGADARLVFVGDGEFRPTIEKIIDIEGVRDRVEITGWVDEREIRRRLTECRALALTSFAEGLPVVIMEALALGRPVLSSCIAGIPELVIPGVNGWLIPAGNADAAASALCEIMETPADRLDEMGRAGQELVRRRHRTSTNVAEIERLMAESVSRSQRGG